MGIRAAENFAPEQSRKVDIGSVNGVAGDLFRTRGNPTIDHLNRMISQVYQSLHSHGDRHEEIKKNLAVDKLIQTIWDEEAADNESMIDL